MYRLANSIAPTSSGPPCSLRTGAAWTRPILCGYSNNSGRNGGNCTKCWVLLPGAMWAQLGLPMQIKNAVSLTECPWLPGCLQPHLHLVQTLRMQAYHLVSLIADCIILRENSRCVFVGIYLAKGVYISIVELGWSESLYQISANLR